MVTRSLYILRIAGVAFAYAFLAKIALSHFSSNGVVSVIWPASGLALATLIIGGKKYWPAILIGAFFANSFHGDQFLEATLIAVGNTVAAFVSLSILSFSSRLNSDLSELRGFLWLGFAGAIGSLVAAVIGIFTILQANIITSQQVLTNLLQWWQGDTLGIILVTPLLLVWQKPPEGWFNRSRILETILCFGLAFIAGQIIFLDLFQEFLPQIRGFWMFIFVTWAAVRFGLHGALLTISMTAAQVLIGTSKSSGLFANDYIQGGLLNAWFYILTLSIIGITLAIIFERELKLKKAARASEAAAARREQRYKLLSEIGDQTRLLTDPQVILTVITNQLGSHLRVSRCVYIELEDDDEHFRVLRNYCDGCLSIEGRHKLSLFGSHVVKTLQAGRTLIINNVEEELDDEENVEAAFNAINVKAIIAYPLIKAGKLQAIMAVQSTVARQWSPYEVSINEEVAERCWAAVERTKAEIERNKLSDIIERSVNEVLLFDVKTLKFTYANQGARKNLGYSMSQLQTMSPADIKTDFDEAAFREMLQPLIDKKEEQIIFEGAHRRSNDSTFPVEVQLQLAGMADETQILAFIQDISERKKSETILAESEQRLRFLNEIGENTRVLTEPQEVLTVITTLLGKYLKASRSAYANVAADGNHFTIPYDYTDNCESMVGTFTLSQFGTFAASQLQSGKMLILNNADKEIPKKDQNAFNAASIKAIICCPLIKGGSLRAMMAVHQKTARTWSLNEIALVREVVERCWAIIERIRAEKERTRFADIIERSLNEIFTFDAKTLLFSYANDGARQNLGYTLDQLLTMTPVDIKPEHNKATFREEIKPLVRKQVASLTFETTHERANGTTYPAEIQLQLADQDGEQILAFVQDITERERVKDELLTTQTAIDNSQTAFFKMDSDGAVTYVNDFACKSLGYTKDELIGMHVTEFDPDFPADAWAPMWKNLKKEKVVQLETRHKRKDGSIFPVEIVGNLINSEGKEYSFTFAQDITERKIAEESLRLAASVYENSSEAMTVSDPDGIILTVNPAFTKITGYTAEEVIGKNRSMLSSGRHDEAFYKSMWDEINTTGHWQGEVLDRRNDGEIYPAWLTINTIFNDDGTPYRRISLFSDSTAWKETEALIWHQANFDALTDLPNRQMFHDRLEQDIKKAHRADQSLALMFLDLDRFKEINDSLGHDIGDTLLKEAATRINSCVREADTVARLGGDEFTIILDAFAKDDGMLDRIAQEILNKIAEPFQLKDEVGYVTASIGITLYPQDATDIDELIKNADQAMYAAKSQGRNRYSYFTPSMQKKAQVRTRMANDLRTALKNNELWLAYQPIIELSTGALYKAEALIRWEHPKLGLISPAQFIPVAEHTGLICEIGEWAFNKSFTQVKAWQKKYGESFQVSVNVSPVQFHDKTNRFKPWQEQLKKAKLSGKSIIVEITEGLLLEANTATNEKLLEFRDAGIQVALDDFGTGYSSLSYLKKFDIDYIKIDQSFVRGLTHNTGDLALCEAMIVMAHKLDMKVIAEGVETNKQQTLLKGIGCDYAQGFLLSKPVPADEFEKLLKN
jgi:diguanylate cyclase (GGDEF)-like protein/PAS domain S-box-containing protein